MLQYPTNFYPENVAIDTDAENNIEFTFNGDFLTAVTFRTINYMTGESADSYRVAANQVPRWYNGDRVMVRGLSNLTNGDDYIIEMLLTQTDDSGSPLYDMAVLSGTVYSVQSDNKTSIFIADRITNIYEWDKSKSIKKPTKYGDFIAAGMIVRINNESRFIESYNVETGEIILDSSFSFDISEGMKYVIKSNYLISAQYFFRCRSTPTITPSLTLYNNFYNNDFTASAEYSQVENSMINYYQLYLYYSNMGTHHASTKLIASTDKIYSQKINYIFTNVIQTERSTDIKPVYQLVCEVVTQNGMTATGEYIMEMPVTNAKLNISNLSTKIDKEKNTFKMSFYYDITNKNADEKLMHDHIRIIRENADTGENLYISTSSHSNRIKVNVIDYAFPTHGNYVYKITGLLGNGAICDGTVKVPVSPNLTGYTITNISQGGDGKYIAGDIWRFSADIKNTTVTQNIDRYLHIGYGQYPVTSSTDVDYLSGTLTGMLGYLNCETKEYTDDITLVKEWRKFITQSTMFMLKSQKGDVWFVNIVDNPTTEYQEDHHKFPTSFSFNWAEVARDITVSQIYGTE